MADWTGPTKDSDYLGLLDALKARDVDSGTMGTPDSPPLGFKRWSDGARRFEVWSGSTWAPLPVGAPWVDWGHTPARLSATQVTIPGDTTALYLVGRRARVVGASGPVVGTITACAYDGVNGWSVVTLALDSGALTAPLSAVSLGVNDTPDALPTIPISRGGTGAGDIPTALSALGVPFAGVVSRTATGAEVLSNRGRVMVCSGTITRTLPLATVGAGVVLAWHNGGSGVVTLARAGSDLLAGRAGLILYPGESAVLVSDGASAWRPLVPLAARLSMPTVDRTSSVTLDALADGGRLQRCSGTVTLTLPSAATAGAGWTLPVINSGSGVVTLARAGSDLIGGAVSRTLSYQGDSLTLVSTGAGWDVIGAVSAAASPMDGFAAQMIGIF